MALTLKNAFDLSANAAGLGQVSAGAELRLVLQEVQATPGKPQHLGFHDVMSASNVAV